MSNFEKLDINKYKISFSVDAEKFEEGLNYSFNKNKNYFRIPGFRKGKAPRKIVEATYGKEVLFNDAVDYVLREAYPAAAKESGLDIVSRPEVDIVEASAENGASFTAIVYVKPDVKISDYKGVTFKKKKIEVTDEDVEERLKREQSKHARIIEVAQRAIQDGDIAVIDFKGFMDGKAFEGGEGKDFELEIGSHSFIDTFEEQLIGKEIGDDVDVNVTFPEDYGKSDLAGKPALFKVEIKGIKIKQLPEINDEFVADTTEFETLEEYKNDIKAKILLSKEQDADNEKKEEILEKLVEKADMVVPDAMIENEIDNKIADFRAGIMQQGLSMDNYLDFMGQSIENMREAYRIISEKQVKARLVLEAIAKEENVQVNDDEIEEEIERIAKNYRLDKDKVRSALNNDTSGIVKDLQVQKALDIVLENAVAE